MNCKRKFSVVAMSKSLLRQSVLLMLFLLGWASAAQAQVAAGSAAIPSSERAVLIDLYTSTNGASWTNNTGWNGAVGTECSWYGVACDATQTHILTIGLSGNHLVGPLPPLSGLTALQNFWVDRNQLTGTIPLLNGLTALQWFTVNNNQLAGSIPSLTGLTALQKFWVNNNQLTGSIPSLSGLTALQFFAADENQLMGPIPSLSGLTALQKFYAYNNQLTGPIPSLSGLTALQSFDVFNNQLTGPIPASSTSLLAGQSYLCNNNLVSSGNLTIDAAWVAAENTSTPYGVAGGNWLACQLGASMDLNLLTITLSGTGSVTSSPTGINCSNTCSTSYNNGATVTLTATPAPGSTFAGWGGACTGTGICTLSINAVTNVTATFNPAPFAVVTKGVTAEGTITDPIATLTTDVSLNADDEGKSESVFVTAWVPSGSLTMAQQAKVASYATLAKPLGTSAANAFVLVQLTSSGWQPVVNGQLIPYVSGVLGAQGAAISILNNTNTANLLGAQFCVGYGASASEMAAAGRMQLVASIPNPNLAKSNTGSCNVALPISDARVFAYAEANYHTYFAGTVTPGLYQQYDYRYYATTQNYLAVDNLGAVWIMGPTFSPPNAPIRVAPVESFRSVITTWEGAP